MNNFDDRIIRLFIRSLIEGAYEEVIDEDDELEGDAKDEVSAGGVAGVTTPLGTGPHYPNPESKKRKPTYIAAGDAFGGARPPKKKKKN